MICLSSYNTILLLIKTFSDSLVFVCNAWLVVCMYFESFSLSVMIYFLFIFDQFFLHRIKIKLWWWFRKTNSKCDRNSSNEAPVA